MDFILSNILLPIMLALIVGLPLSIYAGFICGRILIFEEIKNKLSEIVYLNSGPFESSLHIKTSVRNIDKMEIIEQRLENLGHKSVTKELSEIILQIRSELSNLESEFNYCEIRQKREPKSTMIGHEIIVNCFERISSMKPSKKQILMPTLKI
jgi:hypothetical protein